MDRNPVAMKNTKSFLFNKVVLALLVVSPGVITAKDSDKLVSIGRGTKLTLIKEIEIPANQNYVDFPVLKVRGPEYGLMNWILFTYVCRLEVKDSSLDRRILPVGTEILLTGEYEENTHAPQPYGTIQGLIIQSPSALQGVTCGGYGQSNAYSSDGSSYQVGKPFGPANLTIGDFKALFSAYLKVEQPAPVVIHRQ